MVAENLAKSSKCRAWIRSNRPLSPSSGSPLPRVALRCARWLGVSVVETDALWRAAGSTAGPVVPRPTGRLAPSPTGRLHLGHGRSFLLAWLAARSQGGRLWLRLEDLDRSRVRPEYTDQILADLEWLGLDWDGEPLVQSADEEPYAAALDALLRAGHAYPCVCSRSDIAARVDAPQAGDGERHYPGTCRGRFDSMDSAERATGRPAGVRLLVPAGVRSVADGVVGEVHEDTAEVTGDLLLLRRDRVYSYHFAVVVDDARQGVTQVLRGDDLATSAVRQAHLQRALGLPHPNWAHVPLVVDRDGRRLAKRAGDLGLGELRERGVDARHLVGALAASAGLLERPAPVEPRELLASFDLKRLPRAPAVVDGDEPGALPLAAVLHASGVDLV